MKIQMRTVKCTPSGTLRKMDVRAVIRGVHVIAKAPNSWEVRFLVPFSETKRFSSRDKALTYAKQVARSSRRKVYEHD